MSLIGKYSPEQIAAEQARFMTKVYMWMAFGLCATAYASYMTINSEVLLQLIFGNKMVFYGLLIGEFALVMVISGLMQRMSSFMAMALFFLYAVMNGLTFSVIFLVYTQQSIVEAFGITAGMFAGLSAYGFFTKRDLSPMGAFMISALWGLILASVVNLFFHNGIVTWITSVAGVVIFSGLTAYDTQKIKELNVIGNEGTAEDTKEAVYGALTLYLDFINLFLSLLRLFGRRK